MPAPCPPADVHEALTPDQCAAIIDARHQGTYRDDYVRERWRCEAWQLDVDLLDDGPASAAADAVRESARRWRIPVTHLVIELKRYRVGHKHGRHVDSVPAHQRRTIAATIQLSDPDDYTGGDLQVWDGTYSLYVFDQHTGAHRLRPRDGHWQATPRDRGAIVVYPASAMHKVTPVTGGVRWAAIVTGTR